MDAPGQGWYFSTVPRRIEFHRTKYGRELLVDAAYVRTMPTFVRTAEPHALAFHDILLVTRGRGRLRLDGEEYRLGPGSVLFSRPGEVRELHVPGLDGACLFFTSEFITSFFSDGRFLDQFTYFRPGRPRAVLPLGAAERRSFLRRFAVMQAEIAGREEDAADALRAELYELLVLLNRWYAARHGRGIPAPAGAAVERFCALVERDFARRHRVREYAREVGVSPNHLNALCRRQLKQTASARVRARLALEARRLLLYSTLTVAEIAFGLGFADPAYFARFFRREAGQAPARYRRLRGRRPRGA
jgi:AraC family transcriptional regulator, transcriptional activator of pobA